MEKNKEMKQKRILSIITAICLTICIFISGSSDPCDVDSTFAGQSSSASAFTYESDGLSNSIYVESAGYTVYDFRDSRNYGIADDYTCIDFEGMSGIRVAIVNGKIQYSVYRHNAGIEPAKVTLYRLDNMSLVRVKGLGTPRLNATKTISTRLNDGLYVLRAEFVYPAGEELYSDGYIYVSGGTMQTVRATTQSTVTLNATIERWENLLADADPADYLSNADVTYPTSGLGNSVVHVAQWEAVADEIVGGRDWTDEAIVWACAKYISENLAYDMYRYNQPNHTSRASLANCWNNDRYFTYGNNVGVCWDFTNILSIMCRHYGIPCTSVEAPGHTFNAVWLNGGWVGIDCTETCQWKCWVEDTSARNWSSNRYDWSRYGTYGISSQIYAHDWNIWTEDLGAGRVTPPIQ